MAEHSENIKTLFELIKENPGLPILPMVDAEIVGDDYARYVGSWGYAYVDEYLIANTYDERVLFKSDDDVFDTLERYLTREEFNSLPESEAECERIYDELPWIKAIVVNIDV